MEWITSHAALESEVFRIGQILTFARLPRQLFREWPNSTSVLELDNLTSGDFFSDALKVAQDLGEECIFWGLLRPDPVSYFFSHFGYFPWLRILPGDSPREVVAALHQDPGGSPADALALNFEVVVIYGRSLRWIIVGDQALEIGLLATMDIVATQIWNGAFREVLLTPEEAVCRLFSASLRSGVRPDIEREFRANYCSAGGSGWQPTRSRRL